MIARAPLSPSEIGERLRRARESADLTQNEAAEKVGLSRSTLLAIELGEREAPAGEILRFASVYRVTASDLLGRRGVNVPLVPQFRKALGDDEAKAGDAVRRLETYSTNYAALERITAAPSIRHDAPHYEVDEAVSPMEEWGELIAQRERERLALGASPLPPHRDLLEQAVGLRVFVYAMPASVAGLFGYSDELGGCVALNSLHPPERRRWTLAHEYGHFLTTRYDPDLNLADAKRWGRPRFERLADAFAGNFLMPRSAVVQRFTELMREKPVGLVVADLVRLADMFGVSVQAMCLRLESLRRVPTGTWDDLWRRRISPAKIRAEAALSSGFGHDAQFPLRYLALAKLAYQNEEISEGALAKYLDTDRVSAREEMERLGLRDDLGGALSFGEALVSLDKSA